MVVHIYQTTVHYHFSSIVHIDVNDRSVLLKTIHFQDRPLSTLLQLKSAKSPLESDKINILNPIPVYFPIGPFQANFQFQIS